MASRSAQLETYSKIRTRSPGRRGGSSHLNAGTGPGLPERPTGIPMSAPNDNTAAKGLRGWWLTLRDPACKASSRHGSTAAFAPSGSHVSPVALSLPPGRRVPLVRRLRMGSLLPGCWGTESRRRLLGTHYRSLPIRPNLSLAQRNAITAAPRLRDCEAPITRSETVEDHLSNRERRPTADLRRVCCLDWLQRMEPLWSPVVATGGNQ